MKALLSILLGLMLLTSLVVGNSPVSADTCSIQPSILAYYTSGVVVPVSATCSFVGGQLYAVGNAIDTSTNAHVGSVDSALSSAYETNIYTGQLAFNLPPEITGHTLQISISIYSGIYSGINSGVNNGFSNGLPLTTSVETVRVNANNYYYNYPNCYSNNNCAYNLPRNNNQLQCPSLTMNNMVQCVGYLYQNPNSCVILVIPVTSSIGLVSYQYYTLQKLPSSYPAIGTWVSVGGQLNRGSNISSTGGACPGNYINVSSITPT